MGYAAWGVYDDVMCTSLTDDYYLLLLLLWAVVVFVVNNLSIQ